jgi:type IV pilus assembly protein PilA
MKKSSYGFSLIELLIVVAIIMIIAAIAIPSFLRSRVAANQASAVGSLRMINTAETTYFTTYGVGYTANLTSLGPPASGASVNSSAAGLVDSVLAAGIKSGYIFVYTPGSLDPLGHYNSYTVTANPMGSDSGTVHYFTDQGAVIRENSTTTAGSTDSPLAG